jgi:chromosome segregation ATPase
MATDDHKYDSLYQSAYYFRHRCEEFRDEVKEQRALILDLTQKLEKTTRDLNYYTSRCTELERRCRKLRKWLSHIYAEMRELVLWFIDVGDTFISRHDLTTGLQQIERKYFDNEETHPD